MRLSRPALWILLALAAAASMWFYAVRIWAANQPPQFSDLYATWWAGHELFLHGRNPYTPAVAHEIQSVIYGSPLRPSPQDPAAIGGGFAYPPYAALLVWPLIYLPFPAAQKLFIAISVLTILSSVRLWLQALRFRVAPSTFFVVAIFTLGSFPAIQSIQLQNPSVIAAVFLAIALYLLSNNRLIPAGIFLAASTIKPQFLVLLIPWLGLWVFTNWRQRRAFAFSFLTTTLALALISEWLLPAWLSGFFRVARSYLHYTYGHSLLDVWFGPAAGPWVAAILIASILAYCWRYRSQPADSFAFSTVISLLLAATLVVIPTLAPHAQLLLIPAFFCLLRDRSAVSQRSVVRLLALAAWILTAWPWLASLALLLLSVRMPVSALRNDWQLPLDASPVLPLAVLSALVAVLYARDRIPARR